MPHRAVYHEVLKLFVCVYTHVHTCVHACAHMCTFTCVNVGNQRSTSDIFSGSFTESKAHEFSWTGWVAALRESYCLLSLQHWIIGAWVALFFKVVGFVLTWALEN